MLTTVLLVLSGVLGGIVLALRVIAPLTKTKVDDDALALAEKAEAVVDKFKPLA